MKLTLICLAVVVAAAIAEACLTDAECSNLNCGHGLKESCVNHKCQCVHHNKRDGGCTSDAECAGTDCTDMPGDTPFCNHHGPADHGHSNCECR